MIPVEDVNNIMLDMNDGHWQRNKDKCERRFPNLWLHGPKDMKHLEVKMPKPACLLWLLIIPTYATYKINKLYHISIHAIILCVLITDITTLTWPGPWKNAPPLRQLGYTSQEVLWTTPPEIRGRWNGWIRWIAKNSTMTKNTHCNLFQDQHLQLKNDPQACQFSSRWLRWVIKWWRLMVILLIHSYLTQAATGF